MVPDSSMNGCYHHDTHMRLVAAAVVSKKRPRADAELTLQGQGSQKQACMVCMVKADKACGCVWLTDVCVYK